MGALRGHQLPIALFCAPSPTRPTATAAGEPLPPLLELPPSAGFSDQAFVAISCPQEDRLGAGPSPLLGFDEDVVSAPQAPHTLYKGRLVLVGPAHFLPSVRSLLER